MNSVTITMAFLMGLTGSLHCAGMCGPIIWVMPFQALGGFKKWVGILLYHLGRISTYALLAYVLYSFRSLFNPRIQQYVSISLGAVLLLVGILTFIPQYTSKFKLPWTGKVQNLLGKFVGRPGVSTLFVTGVLNGLLPCGLVYMALSASISSCSPLQSIGFMYAFGVGTMPMLISITILRSKASFLRFSHLRKLVPVFMFAFGCLFILRGMNLGIAYLSPKVEVQQHGIKSCCCHKK